MKVLLIKPPQTLPKNFKGVARFFPSVGLGYLASSLEKAGHSVKILDAGIEKWQQVNVREDGVKYIGMRFEEIQKAIEAEKPDLVGITTLTVDAFNAHQVARVSKAAGVKVVMGGCHVSVRPDETLKDDNVDYVVVGEGEETIVELANALKEGKALNGINGLMFKENGNIVRNEPRAFRKDMDSLPFPAWHLLPMKKYFEISTFLQGSHLIPERHFSIATSRSCPYDCVFCSVRTIMGKGFRPRSPWNVIAEMEKLIEDYKIKFFSIEDDNLTLDRARIDKILDLMIERGISKKIKWDTPNGLRADTLDEPLLLKMKEAGASLIYVSPESGSQRVVNEVIKKNLDLKRVEDAVRICQKIGLRIGCFFVIGLPGETKSEIEETVAFAKKLRELGAMTLCTIARPTYGTDLYKICKDNGYLVADEKELELGILNAEGTIKTPEFTPEDLKKYAEEIRQGNEQNEMRELIRKRPLYLLKLFIMHPLFITKYVIKKYAIGD